MAEHREYECRPGGDKGSARRLVKLPGEKGHARRSDSAKVIARRIALDKAEGRLRALKDG